MLCNVMKYHMAYKCGPTIKEWPMLLVHCPQKKRKVMQILSREGLDLPNPTTLPLTDDSGQPYHTCDGTVHAGGGGDACSVHSSVPCGTEIDGHDPLECKQVVRTVESKGKISDMF
ncbi:hypothetical protein V6N12_008734 [Hibiscus sabdariffa]